MAGLVAREIQDPNCLVLALPRGGVPVAFQVAGGLHAELDVLLVRKLGLPGEEELAIGAVASGGVRVLNEDLVRELHLSPSLIDQITAREERELERREDLYREHQPPAPIRGRTVILVDDGLATGASMKAAILAVRLQEPGRVIVAVPVAARQTCEEFSGYVDKIVCAYAPSRFMAVGVWYEEFAQTTDEEVRRLLAASRTSPKSEETHNHVPRSAVASDNRNR